MFAKSAIIAFMTVWLAGCQMLALTIQVRFDQAAGLARQDRVLFEGRTAGSVEKIESGADGAILARLKIDRQFKHVATEYAQFFLVEDPAQVGRKAVDVRVSRSDGRMLADGATVNGVSPSPEWVERLRRGFEDGVKVFKKQFEELERDFRSFPESAEFQRLQKSLQELTDEIARSEQQARQKIKEQWLPRLEQELERLKQKIAESHPESNRDQELQELEKQVERIRRI